MDSIYWVVSRDCNQKCAHCYNDSEPGAPGLTEEEVSRCVANFPDPARVKLNRIIISGGEILVWPELLFHTLRELHARYGDATKLYVQTNGDLLDDEMIKRLIDHHVFKIDVASMDKFHKKGTFERKEPLEAMFRAHGFEDPEGFPFPDTLEENRDKRFYAFWGATEDQWIGPLWPRGRARKYGHSRATPENRFCAIWSGAANFLNYDGDGCEVNVQLSDVYPCCPMTFKPIGSLLEENLIDILDRCAGHPVFQALNEGNPEAMGVSLGVPETHGIERSEALGNHCLWCDEFFAQYAPELLYDGGRTERGRVDLDTVPRKRSAEA